MEIAERFHAKTETCSALVAHRVVIHETSTRLTRVLRLLGFFSCEEPLET